MIIVVPFTSSSRNNERAKQVVALASARLAAGRLCCETGDRVSSSDLFLVVHARIISSYTSILLTALLEPLCLASALHIHAPAIFQGLSISLWRNIAQRDLENAMPSSSSIASLFSVPRSTHPVQLSATRWLPRLEHVLDWTFSCELWS